ncbi:MAG: bifunctional folylpolyglutamate synthase/dihydrofolate synthase, partial [Campylobacter sp.]|nr:bifunctional folylpolyglutamate synthase/dihydrofolate synthase [Campylobacter sp.]
TLLGGFELKNLGELTLKGRCERIAENLYVDVGHNELGAQAIAKKFMSQNLGDKKITLVYNSFLDKDFHAVLATLKSVVSNVLIYDYESVERELGGDLIKKTLNDLKLPYRDFTGKDMEKILARSGDKIYLVFGSFYLAEAFLRDYYASKGL